MKMILNQYKETFKYIFESRRYIYFSIIAFAIVFIIGLFQPPVFSDVIDDIMNNPDEDEVNTFSIFTHNTRIEFLRLATGFFAGIGTMIITLFNAYFFGFLFAGMREVFIEYPKHLIPLGVIGGIEFTIGFISTGLGLRNAMFIFNKNKNEYIVYNAVNSFKYWLLIVLPVLLFGAWLEMIFILHWV